MELYIFLALFIFLLLCLKLPGNLAFQDSLSYRTDIVSFFIVYISRIVDLIVPVTTDILRLVTPLYSSSSWHHLPPKSHPSEIVLFVYFVILCLYFSCDCFARCILNIFPGMKSCFVVCFVRALFVILVVFVWPLYP